jgi:hypothetical protein
MEEHEETHIDSNINSNTIMDENLIPRTNETEIKDKTTHQLKTEEFIQSIKNPVFKINIVDTDTNQVVSSIYLIKKTKLGRTLNTMVWQFFRHRSKLDVNKIIKQYGRENLIINYKIFQ